MDTNGRMPGEGGATTADGLAPTTQANLIARALRKGWTNSQRQTLIDEFFRVAMDGNRAVRDRAACARVLATLERNEIAAERNQVMEHSGELSAATDRLRATLSSPEARAALANLSGQMCQPALPGAPSLPPQPHANEETTGSNVEPGVELRQGDGWASAGGSGDD